MIWEYSFLLNYLGEIIIRLYYLKLTNFKLDSLHIHVITHSINQNKVVRDPYFFYTNLLFTCVVARPPNKRYEQSGENSTLCHQIGIHFNDDTNDYKSRLLNFNNILMLMYTYEITDTLFLIKSIPTSTFNINHF